MKTCLIVDDNSFDRRMIETCASKSGLSVSETTNAEDALEICKKSPPDCIILDWELEGMSGIDMLKQLRQLPQGAKIPVIICTSHEHSSFIGYAYVSGANSYITKPLSQAKLETELQKLGII